MEKLETQASKKLPHEELFLPEGWKHTLPKEQHHWVSKALFTRDASGKVTLTDPLQMWWHPPEPQCLYSQPPPSPDPFFHSRLFLWMPCRMLGQRLLCTKPNCRRLGNYLRPCGLHDTVRRVLDFSGWYFMVTENLECSSCRKKVAGWSQDVMDQLNPLHCATFPAVLTYRLSCDKHLVKMMMTQARTSWRSATATHRLVCVQHNEKWMGQVAHYVSVLRKFEDLSAVTVWVPQMIPVPSPSLLLAVYAKNVLTRLGEMKARVTSVYGSILKITSTSKVTKKLGSAVCATSIGNENGEVLMCVLTQTEGEDLLPMCSGVVERYQRAGQPPPRVLYVSSDCCSRTGTSRVDVLFPEWDQLIVRLDAWHFMQGFASGLTSESHMLYGDFMGRLFSCIFEWDVGDLNRLREAKKQERQSEDPRASSRLTAEELLRHCRHQTRGALVTRQLIEQLLNDVMAAKDFMGNKLVNQERMEEIWRAQQHHLLCIQDPPGVQLYKKVKEVTRGGLVLPIYNCARGVRSLESFHQHLHHFIPGTRTVDLLFHVYLLEGVVQWNKSRSSAVDECSPLLHYANHLSQKVLGYKLVEDHKCHREYTGELIGVEYLYSQTNRMLEVDAIMDPDAPDMSDEQLGADLEHEDSDSYDLRAPGFLEFSLRPLHPSQCQAALQKPPSFRPSTSQPDPIVSSTSGPIKDEPVTVDQFTPQDISQKKEEKDENEKCVGPEYSYDVPGYKHVINLANSLVELRNQGFVTQRKVYEIIALWDRLSDHDKSAVAQPARPQDGLNFNCNSDAFVTPCIDGLKSRLVSAVCLALCHIHPADQMIAGVRVNRWAAILRDYSMIRNIVQDSAPISTRTQIQLQEINLQTLYDWYNARKLKQEQGTSLPVPQSVPEPPHHRHLGDVIKVVIGLPNPPNAIPLQPNPLQNAFALSPPSPKVPRTTAWRRRKAEEEAVQRGIPLKRLCEQYLCKKCGTPKTKEFGHSQYRGVHFCAKASGKTVEQWMEEMRRLK